VSKEAIDAGHEFGKIIIESLKRTGVPSEGRLVFYCTEIGVQMGNIAAHVGKGAALAILDVIRAEIANLPSKEPS
jgi:hypothetical protein